MARLQIVSPRRVERLTSSRSAGHENNPQALFLTTRSVDDEDSQRLWGIRGLPEAMSRQASRDRMADMCLMCETHDYPTSARLSRSQWSSRSVVLPCVTRMESAKAQAKRRAPERYHFSQEATALLRRLAPLMKQSVELKARASLLRILAAPH